MTRKLRRGETRFYYLRRGFGLGSSFESHIFLHSRGSISVYANLEEKGWPFAFLSSSLLKNELFQGNIRLDSEEGISDEIRARLKCSATLCISFRDNSWPSTDVHMYFYKFCPP